MWQACIKNDLICEAININNPIIQNIESFHFKTKTESEYQSSITRKKNTALV